MDAIDLAKTKELAEDAFLVEGEEINKEQKEQFKLDLGGGAPPELSVKPDPTAAKTTVKGDYTDSPERPEDLITPADQYKDVDAEQKAQSLLRKEQEDAQAESAKQKQKKSSIFQRRKEARAARLAAMAEVDTDDKATERIIEQNERVLALSESNRKHRRIVLIIMFAAIAVVLILWGVAALITGKHGFTVSVNGTNLARIQLADNVRLNNPTTMLSTEDIPGCDPVTYSDMKLAAAQTDNADGLQSVGDRYFAYSFYVINTGTQDTDFYVNVNVVSYTNNAIGAVRIMLVSDTRGFMQSGNTRTLSVYARPTGGIYGEGYTMDSLYNRDGSIMSPDEQDNAIPFYSDAQPVHERHRILGSVNGVASIRKYTVLFYVEGGDPDCNNALKGSNIRLNMNFTVA